MYLQREFRFPFHWSNASFCNFKLTSCPNSDLQCVIDWYFSKCASFSESLCDDIFNFFPQRWFYLQEGWLACCTVIFAKSEKWEWSEWESRSIQSQIMKLLNYFSYSSHDTFKAKRYESVVFYAYFSSENPKGTSIEANHVRPTDPSVPKLLTVTKSFQFRNKISEDPMSWQ